ncbi:MAG: site-2 protease family protein, partial [Anaerolineales bacterium]|nr:site-2 protease family protein [Anaerolineales bacterium]
MQLLSFIVGLIVLILVHEIGHFLAARLLKVDVEEFGIGFPPRMVKLFERNGTIYSLNWIPLGGFVRLKGENDPSIPGSLAAASPWVRLGVLFAGPLMNLAAGVLLGILFYSMVGDPKPLILTVAPNSPAESVDLRAGDLITRVNDHNVTTTGDLQTQIYAVLDQSTQITYQRVGQISTVNLTPRSNPPEGQGAIGIELAPP